MVDVWVQTLFRVLEHVPDICLFHIQRHFLVKSKTFHLETTLLKCQIIRNSGLSDAG
jgi:hypothetical protein